MLPSRPAVQPVNDRLSIQGPSRHVGRDGIKGADAREGARRAMYFKCRYIIYLHLKQLSFCGKTLGAM